MLRGKCRQPARGPRSQLHQIVTTDKKPDIHSIQARQTPHANSTNQPTCILSAVLMACITGFAAEEAARNRRTAKINLVERSLKIAQLGAVHAVAR